MSRLFFSHTSGILLVLWWSRHLEKVCMLCVWLKDRKRDWEGGWRKRENNYLSYPTILTIKSVFGYTLFLVELFMGTKCDWSLNNVNFVLSILIQKLIVYGSRCTSFESSHLMQWSWLLILCSKCIEIKTFYFSSSCF